MHVDPDTLYLIYDEECVLCRYSANAMRLRKSVTSFELINARDDHHLITIAKKRNLNLNEGIIVFYQNQIWTGSDALHHLALLMTPFNSFNRISSFLFKRKWVSRLSYPLLKSLRQLLLWIRNKKRIHYS